MKHKGKFLGAGIFGLIIGGIAGLFLSPKSGKENRKDLGHWMQKMSKEIDEHLNEAREMSQENYNRLVDTIADKYKRAQNIKEQELNDFIDDLKARWHRIKDKWQE